MTAAARPWLAIALLAAVALVAFGCKSSSKSTTARTTSTPAVASTRQPTPDHTSDVRSAVQEYAAAVVAGDGAFVVDHLHATAKHYYSADTCRTFFSRIGPDATFAINVHGISGPGPWTWVVYGKTVATIPDVYTLTVTITQHGASREGEAHFTWDAAAGKLRVFSPCVAPPQ